MKELIKSIVEPSGLYMLLLFYFIFTNISYKELYLFKNTNRFGFFTFTDLKKPIFVKTHCFLKI